MTRASELGHLSTVDLREAWSSEAQDFTPWLAEPDNLEVLGKALGLALEVDSIEKPVGACRADILCREIDSNRLVLIENQIEVTDHRHLGQLLTYAAGLDTAVICWIARRFSEEHRAVLDWLNEITEDRFAFFGIEIELWRIGTSPMAPRFNVIAKPNEWRRAVSKGANRVRAEEPIGIDVNRVAYWTAFEAMLDARSGPLESRGRPPRMGVYFFTIAKDVYLYAYRNVARREIGVYLALYGQSSRSFFEALSAEGDALDQAAEATLEWRILEPDRKYRIVAPLPGTDVMNEADWPRQHGWLIDHLERLEQAFRPRLTTLSLAVAEDGVR